jgi:para-aminobenzoate synthetase/4-amino-4-deoxychorismate lyase
MITGVPACLPTTAAVVREPLGVALDTWRAPLLLRGRTEATALLGDWAGGSRAILAPGPAVTTAAADADRFATLDRVPRVGAGADIEGWVGGGWFGVLGYPLGRRIERIGGPPPRPAPLPEVSLAYHDHVLRQDADGDWWFEALLTDARADLVGARLEALRAQAQALQSDGAGPSPFATGPWHATPSAGGHAAAVDACVERIAHGDLFQANICQRLASTIDGDMLDVFVTAWRALRPAKAAFTQGPWGALASLSPELYLRRDGRRVVSSPIKGTRPRGADPHADAEAEAELQGAEKDRAEHVMIVDLVRNDLGRVCVPGSVHVPALMEPREAPGVWHLVSDVAGELRAGVGDGELLRATFPPGSVTGAPKVAAMRVIHELESTGRETYTGAIGLVSPAAGLDFNVAIRTFEASGDRIWLGVGGGIVADSVGDDEAREAADKAAPLLAAIGAPPFAVAGRPRGDVIHPSRRSPVPLPRPEPELGVFETILVVDGEPAGLGRHLARLGASTLALYGLPVDGDEIATLVTAALDVRLRGRRRLRIDARPAGGGLVYAAVCTPLPAGAGDPAAPPVALRPVVVPGGLGPHKWSDRRLWDALAAEAPGTLPLAIDLDGLVLETSRANVFAVLDDGVVATPPIDGRILPGLTRERLLADLRADGRRVDERPLPLDDLRSATEILLTGALRGVETAILR